MRDWTVTEVPRVPVPRPITLPDAVTVSPWTLSVLQRVALVWMTEERH